MKTACFLPVAFVLAATFTEAASAQKQKSPASALLNPDARVLSLELAKQAGQALWDSVKARRDLVHDYDRRAWQKVRNLDDWQKMRSVRLEALRRSLGQFPPAPKNMPTHVTRTIKGDGFLIDNLLYETRPGLWVSANLYKPLNPKSSPGLQIIHSHHNPKTQGELQDMGMTWARLGCYVLVPDQLGHGERRQHPFIDAKSYPDSFKPGRQDYYFRYNVGIQLHLIGESLIGWMVWDTMRGNDVLQAQPGIDKERIILLGSVAGGGDPAAVTAALDERIKAAVPFNFGGPQPETKYPLPESTETSFNYLGGGGWESTRNQRLSGRDGFLPWVIVASIAPRGLVYAHEFAWDQQRDPVWKRLQILYEHYNAKDRLASAHGEGSVRGTGPGNTHCNNIGPEHRAFIYPALKKWFDIPIPEGEYRQRLPADELRCWTAEWHKKLQPKMLHDVADQVASERIKAMRQRLDELLPEERAGKLRQQWHELLGLPDLWEAIQSAQPVGKIGDIEVHKITYTMAGLVPIRVPVLYLVPKGKTLGRSPMVIGLAQEGKQGFLRHRAEAIDAMLNEGLIVCLPDLRGTGETKIPGDHRGRTSASTSLSSSEWMLGQSLLGQRLLDLLAILPKDAPIALWGDSFAPVYPRGRRLDLPLDTAKLPDPAEPLGSLLALYGGLYSQHAKAVYVRGGLVSFQSILESPFLYVPHDVIVPGALTSGDLCDLAAALTPRPLKLEALVEGRNRLVDAKRLEREYELVRTAYRRANQEKQFQVSEDATSAPELAKWFGRALSK